MALIEQRRKKDGEASWRVQIRVKGYPTVTNTFTSHKAAKTWASVIEGQMRDGKYNHTSESLKKTLSDAIQRYVELELPKRSTDRKKVESQLEWWRGQLGHYALKDVTTARIRECQDRLEASLSQRGTPMAATTVLRYMVSLSHLFSVASKQWEWTSDNPVLRVKKPVPDNTRNRVLSEAEHKALLAACKASPCRYLYPVVVLALTTAARRSEIMGLRWNDVDLQRRQLKFEKTKNGDKRAVGIAAPAFEVLTELKRVQHLYSPFLFPRADGKAPMLIQKHWLNALEEAKIEGFHFHDLRHTAATNLAVRGATILQLREILGHRTVQMVTRYAHLTSTHNTEILEKAAASMFGTAT